MCIYIYIYVCRCAHLAHGVGPLPAGGGVVSGQPRQRLPAGDPAGGRTAILD